MITLKGVKKPIYIPDSWKELTPEQYIFTVQKLLQLLSKAITLTDFRIALLLNYTGYRPSWHPFFEEKRFTRSVINENLVRMAELIKFPLRQGKERIEINNIFECNPIPKVYIGLRRFFGKTFNIGVVIRTNITAREFTDALDLAKAFAETQSEECLNSLCAILYPVYKDYVKNLNSRHYKRFQNLSYEIRYGILIWFTGIVQYFYEHPTYQFLFQESDTAAEKLSLGMQETIMHLSLVGFGSKVELESISVVDYFDLQVKSIKKMISDAKAAGAKTDDIARQTKMSYTLINQLS